MTRIATLLIVAAAVAHAAGENPHPTNVNFSHGEAGGVPPGWELFDGAAAVGYSAQLRRDCPGTFTNCVRFQAPASVSAVKAAELAQSFPAAPYIGKTVIFQGWRAVRDDGEAAIELRLRVDHRDGRREFFDSLDGPVDTSAPQRRDVRGYVSLDAVSVEIWARYMPSAPAWVFDPSFEVADPSNAEEDNVRAVIRQFAAARNAHDGSAVAALYTEDGEWFGPTGQYLTHGRVALAALWSSVTGQATRSIRSIDFPGGNIAVVRAAVTYSETEEPGPETFVLVKQNGGWFIRLHQTTGY